jgi:hypothetical protein
MRKSATAELFHLQRDSEVLYNKFTAVQGHFNILTDCFVGQHYSLCTVI